LRIVNAYESGISFTDMVKNMVDNAPPNLIKYIYFVTEFKRKSIL